jgi:hypothetical protein
MTAFNHFTKLSGVLACLAVSVSCGDVVRQGRSPVYLVVDQLTAKSGGGASTSASNVLQSDVVTMVTTPAPCSALTPCATVFSDSGQVSLRVQQKDVSATAPTTNSDVTINRYHVSYRRSDGRNVEGVDVPYSFDGAATGTSSNGKLDLSFEIVRHVAKMESPLVELGSNAAIITTIAEVTFYGRDQVGNDVTVGGSIQIDFGNFGDK